jgi:topoisomerase (DNA) II binding protein 1
MTAEWITQVWEKGKHDNIHATDPTFTRYKCPALMGLTLTVSQMGRKEKELLKRSIEGHGGTYTGQLDMDLTQILIVSKPEGDKYKYAKKWKIPCISQEWVFDSIEKGYCLHTEGYRIENTRGSTSTPTKVSRITRVISERYGGKMGCRTVLSFKTVQNKCQCY